MLAHVERVRGGRPRREVGQGHSPRPESEGPAVTAPALLHCTDIYMRLVFLLVGLGVTRVEKSSSPVKLPVRAPPMREVPSWL